MTQLTINPKPDFPAFIDSTNRSMWVDCPHKYFLGVLNKIAPATTSIHLNAGAAFAKGMEAARKAYYVDKLSRADAETSGARALLLAYGDYVCGENDVKTPERMLGAFDYYMSIWPLDEDPVRVYCPEGTPAVEFSFAIPIDVKHPITGDPILYCGRFDAIGEFGGALYAIDEKTTSSLGAQWNNQWALRGQMIGYQWSARQFGHPVVGALIRGVSILKTKYDHAQSVNQFPDWLVDRWYEQLCRDVRNMITAWDSGVFDQAFADPCNSYGGCQFKMLCSSPNPESWLSTYYQFRDWNPLWTAKA